MNLQALTTPLSALAVARGGTVLTPATVATTPTAAATASPSAIVTLSGTVAADAAATYVMPRPVLTWASSAQDAISAQMARGITSQTAADSLHGLATALFGQIATGGGDFTQAVQSTDPMASRGLADVGLTITTANGHTITLALHAENGGLSASLTGTDGLSDNERAALGKLTDDVQHAMDGATGSPPRIDLGGLASLDRSTFASISFKALTAAAGGPAQSVNFEASPQGRAIHVDTPTGKVDVSGDLSQPGTWGSPDQRDEALKAYLTQFSAAASRGHADASLVQIFKDAFTQINQAGDALPDGTRSTRSGWLTDSDHAVLSGLADFSASLTQTPVASNPYRADERDTFAYQVSQTTRVTGRNAANRGIQQDTQSSLHASFHSSLSADASLALSMLPSSQNYYFNQIDDSSASGTHVQYADGTLVQADQTRSAQQSTRQSKYVMAKLVDETSTPLQTSSDRDLLGVLTELDKQPSFTAQARARRASALASLHTSLI